MIRSAVVPHHRVDALLHARARDRAHQVRTSLSAVAEAGLAAYAAGTPEASTTAPSKGRPAVTLPEAVAQQIAAYAAVDDPRLNSYLAAAHTAGWPYAAMAAHVGITRQGVYLRVQQAQAAPASDIPEIPTAPYRASTAPHGRYDWAIWVSRDTYLRASAHAHARNEPMRDVMEGILRAFVAGTLTVPPADDNPVRHPRTAHVSTIQQEVSTR